ncbi:MAG: chlorosome envelope protein B [Chlorobiaceae bacterium]|nr:chlorosome envelope protein B [Chlorobiaceae bacterium]NTW10665.1 chlorosome envelope protein B [Chlorobiaceae bacterium]
MSNGTTDLSAGISNLASTAGKLFQQQAEMLTGVLSNATQLIGPFGKASLDAANSILNAASQALQTISAAIAKK